MADKISILEHYKGELNKIFREINVYNSNNEYLYVAAMKSYIQRYNGILKKYKTSSGIPLELYVFQEHEYSSTKKTIRKEALERFNINIESTVNLIENMIDKEKSKVMPISIPNHQMRRCLKLNTQRCPLDPKLDKNKVFVGMSFNNKYKDSYEYGIKMALDSLGMNPYKADEDISSKDIMCKICEQMQMCKYLIFNISGHNPNVMLELGLSYGLGKKTIIVKDQETESISDIANIEYIEYKHAKDLCDKLIAYFR